MSDEAGGRLFFTNLRRGLVDEDEINLTSVGIDIGSSTTHLAFSCITLERADARYIVVSRNLFFESAILLTPYAAHNEIDTEKLGAFIKEQYRLSGIGTAEVDTGALILTGTALLRKNARAIADLFSENAGKFVAVSAGDEMEALLAAHGSGAVARSNKGSTVLNVDIGGGTAKIARCRDGQVEALTAIDVGARLIAVDPDNVVTRLEPAGRAFARMCGVPVELGIPLAVADKDRIASSMADKLMQTMSAQPIAESALLRLPALPEAPPPDVVIFSGGVSEYIYDRESRSYGDLGLALARELAARVIAWGVPIEPSTEGIRATVIGASQYTVQVSGSTIFVSDLSVLPLRNIPAIKPPLALEAPDSTAITAAIRASMSRLGTGYPAIALCYSWNQSATFSRLDAFCRGVFDAFAADDASTLPLILVGDSDVGGLIGLHFAEELKVKHPIVSVDGISLQDFDFIDIGAFLEGSGSLPVVVKSLIFPASTKVE